jgi:hypothetical protein
MQRQVSAARVRNPDNFEFVVIISPREREPPNDERKPYLVEMAAQNIKRLPHSGQKSKTTTAWVEEHFPTPEEMRAFVQKVPIATVILILRGVTNFGNGKKEEMVV